MKYDFDVIVIGSGFGGSVMSCRLTEKGHKVCLLERGQEWKMHSFPRRIQDMKQKLPWAPKEKKFGFMEIRDYPESESMSVTGAGLGGGSLVYANVMLRMPAEFFAGWPGKIDRGTLDPYYDRVEKTLEASPYPFNSDPFYKDTAKTQALKQVAENLNAAPKATARPEFLLPPLAIRFQGDFPGHQTLNSHGALQSKCTKCGECDIGCNIHAKNTLDLNYIFRGRNFTGGKAPLEVRTHAEVCDIKDISSGDQSLFEVTYINPTQPEFKQVLTAKRVVVSAGSIHSSELLLKMKKKGFLPHLSSQLGTKWCGNGDLGSGILETKNFVEPTDGPVITAAIQYRYQSYPDGFPHGLFIEDAGVPVGLDWYLSGKLVTPKTIKHSLLLVWHFLTDVVIRFFKLKLPRREPINIGSAVLESIDQNSFTRRIFVMLGMGRDRSDGSISLGPDGEAMVNWDLTGSQLHYDRTRFEMKRIAKKLGGVYVDNPLTEMKKIIAVHPLGGCPMADSENEGVVSTKGEVFGHKGLYVVDGSILPTSVGANPSMTIAAIAEMIAEHFPPADQ